MISTDFKKYTLLVFLISLILFNISCEEPENGVLMLANDSKATYKEVFYTMYNLDTKEYHFLGSSLIWSSPVISTNGQYIAVRNIDTNEIAIIDENGFSVFEIDMSLNNLLNYTIGNDGLLYFGYYDRDYSFYSFDYWTDKKSILLYKMKENYLTQPYIDEERSSFIFNNSKKDSIDQYYFETRTEKILISDPNVYGPYYFKSNKLYLYDGSQFFTYDISTKEKLVIGEDLIIPNHDYSIENETHGKSLEAPLDIVLHHKGHAEQPLTMTSQFNENGYWVDVCLLKGLRDLFQSTSDDNFTLRTMYFGKTFKDEDAAFFYDDNTHFYLNDVEKNIQITSDQGIQYLNFDNDEKKLMLVSDDLMDLYNSDGSVYFTGTSIRGNVNNFIPLSYKASSFLTEGKTEYRPENLSGIELNKPWVEAADGYGIGETITISSSSGNFSKLILSNGFVSFEKPYLYNKNGRLKKIKISDPEGNFTIVHDLVDTPNPQSLYLPYDSKEVTITILDAYPGTTWEDTCVNFIVGK